VTGGCISAAGVVGVKREVRDCSVDVRDDGGKGDDRAGEVPGVDAKVLVGELDDSVDEAMGAGGDNFLILKARPVVTKSL
jgi:hypothetical protein